MKGEGMVGKQKQNLTGINKTEIKGNEGNFASGNGGKTLLAEKAIKITEKTSGQISEACNKFCQKYSERTENNPFVSASRKITDHSRQVGDLVPHLEDLAANLREIFKSESGMGLPENAIKVNDVSGIEPIAYGFSVGMTVGHTVTIAFFDKKDKLVSEFDISNRSSGIGDSKATSWWSRYECKPGEKLADYNASVVKEAKRSLTEVVTAAFNAWLPASE